MTVLLLSWQMYNEIIAALEEAAKDESAITVFTGKILKGSEISELLALQKRSDYVAFVPTVSVSADHVVPSSEAFSGCFRMAKLL